jgi:hypothetical protein
MRSYLARNAALLCGIALLSIQTPLLSAATLHRVPHRTSAKRTPVTYHATSPSCCCRLATNPKVTLHTNNYPRPVAPRTNTDSTELKSTNVRPATTSGANNSRDDSTNDFGGGATGGGQNDGVGDVDVD